MVFFKKFIESSKFHFKNEILRKKRGEKVCFFESIFRQKFSKKGHFRCKLGANKKAATKMNL